MEKNFYHSVALDTEKCRGCTHCIKRCPTEAIRVREGKARIIKERCIDCGECIRICPYHAKLAITDSPEILKNYQYTVALPAPALYGQFGHLEDVNLLLAALLEIGFDDVFEVAKAAEIVSNHTREYLKRADIPKPVISAACPSVVRLIRVRFPQLLEHLLPFHAPMELAAIMARKEAAEKTGLKPEEIGIVFLSPCPAKKTAATQPLGVEKSQVDAVLSIAELYPLLQAKMKTLSQAEERSASGRIGIGWGASGGEAVAVMNDRYLAADGLENVNKTLEEMEDRGFMDLDYVELNACPGGCVGGVLMVENPYAAKAKLKKVSKYLPVSRNQQTISLNGSELMQAPIQYEPVLQLSPDRAMAIRMLQEIQEVEARLGGIDCGSCGAPSCRAHAEDIVRGFAAEEGCIYRLRERVEKLSQELMELAETLPQAMLKGREMQQPLEKEAEKNDKQR